MQQASCTSTITKLHLSYMSDAVIISTMVMTGKSKTSAKGKVPRLTEKSIKQSIAECESGNYKEFKTVKDLLHDIDS